MVEKANKKMATTNNIGNHEITDSNAEEVN